MSPRRFAAKRDANEATVVSALVTIGCLVTRLSGDGVPDLLVWSPFRKCIVLIEVKASLANARAGRKGGVRNEAQREFMEKWGAAGAPVYKVLDVLGALRAVGVPLERKCLSSS